MRTTTLAEQDIAAFEAEIKAWTTKLENLEIEQQFVHVTDKRFDEIVREKNQHRYKLKCLQTRLENMGALSKYSLEMLQSIPRF